MKHIVKTSLSDSGFDITAGTVAFGHEITIIMASTRGRLGLTLVKGHATMQSINSSKEFPKVPLISNNT